MVRFTMRHAKVLVPVAVFLVAWAVSDADSAPLPGGTLDPLAIPKFVTPLVIPPVMHDNGTANRYGIAVRQFRQQILPGGIWNTLNGRQDAFPATTIWSYGPNADNVPDSSGLGGGLGIAPAPNSQFNYPAYTIETSSGTSVNVRWINDLKDPVTGNFLPHLLSVDQTLHWANPPARGCMMGAPDRTDCMTDNAAPYTGPVPLVTHVHGAHVDPHSDGYPEAWWLPAANDIPSGYSTKGSFFDDATGTNPGNLGYADFRYRNDNPATTLWYHDHALGMTRSNVYAGPAGFWLVRGGPFDGATIGAGGGAGGPATLPGPAPVAGQTVLQLNVPTDPVRRSIREIPIAIQDRSFNDNGTLFYPDNRAFFEGLNFPGHPEQFAGAANLVIQFAPTSDIAPIWNPEAFFNTMVVNGSTWPVLEVAPAFYRFRLLNGCNSRFLNLSLCVVDPATDNCAVPRVELPFYQIGAEQGFLSNVVLVQTGFATPLPGDGRRPPQIPAVPAVGGTQQALLMGLAERADVIVDFTGLGNGTRIRMVNTGPDSPFGGFPIDPLAVADDNTTGQVMQFVVNTALFSPSDAFTTPPELLVLNKEPALGPALRSRQVSLNEAESAVVCAAFDIFGDVVQLANSTPPQCAGGGAPFAPKAAKLGVVNLSNPAAPLGTMLDWDDTSGTSMPVQVTMADNVTKKTVNITENPRILAGVAPIEEWEIYNFTVDAHPIHLHLVEFQVVNRAAIPGMALISGGLQPWESGFKDTVIAYPGEITTVRAKFDIPGLYVWHCHIVEHEDNEMMRPYVVSIGPKRGHPDFDGDSKTDIAVWRPGTGEWYVRRSLDNAAGVHAVFGSPTARIVPGDYDGDGKTDVAVWDNTSGDWSIMRSSDGGIVTTNWGAPADVPVPGDFDGDGKADPAVYRAATGVWFILRSTVGFDHGQYQAYAWGGDPTDISVIGDFDGDGKADPAVYRAATGVWFILESSNGYSQAQYKAYKWGDPLENEVPVPGDYDGDGKTDPAVYRASSGVWFVLESSNGYSQAQYKAYAWGGDPTDIPVPGDYDGDGKTDPAVYRDSTGVWFILESSNGYDPALYKAYTWGDPASQDVPVKSLP